MFISMYGEAEDIPIADYEMMELENQKIVH
jgi:hypothetical protein